MEAMIKGKALNFLLTFENKEATLEPTSLEKCCSIITPPICPTPINMTKRILRGKQQKNKPLITNSSCRGLTSSIADSSMRRGASADSRPCVAMM